VFLAFGTLSFPFVHFTAQLVIFTFQTIDIDHRGCAQMPLDVIHGIAGSFGFFVQVYQDFGKGIQDARFFKIASKFFLFRMIVVAVVVVAIIIVIAVAIVVSVGATAVLWKRAITLTWVSVKVQSILTEHLLACHDCTPPFHKNVQFLSIPLRAFTTDVHCPRSVYNSCTLLLPNVLSW
jgi:hypothetical protein